MAEEKEEITDNCPICLNDKVISSFETLRCKHLFCKECLNKWKDEGKNTCPLCRAIIDPNVPANSSGLFSFFDIESTNPFQHIEPSIRRSYAYADLSSLDSNNSRRANRNGNGLLEVPQTPRPGADEEQLIDWFNRGLELNDDEIPFLSILLNQEAYPLQPLPLLSPDDDDEEIREPHPLPVDDSHFLYIPINQFEPLRPLPRLPRLPAEPQTPRPAVDGEIFSFHYEPIRAPHPLPALPPYVSTLREVEIQATPPPPTPPSSSS